METPRCDYLVPDHDPWIGKLPCLLRSDHAEKFPEHLIRDRNGNYRCWEGDPECGTMEGCERDFCECFISREVSTHEADEILREHG